MEAVSSGRRGRFKQLIAAEMDDEGECLMLVEEEAPRAKVEGEEEEFEAPPPPEMTEVMPLRKREVGVKSPEPVEGESVVPETGIFSSR